MSLTDYRRKRQFDRTREPEPGKAVPPGGRAIFVVQLHHASRRHYDFRLQIGDALKSWAVPKGPSFDPKVKRLAAEVEDHPVDYAGFEGDIPKGQYGGGHVALFDRGVWSTPGDAEEQLAKGHLRFELFGGKLRGGWHLVRSQRRSRQPEWLLFKMDDAYAGPLEADDLLDDVTPPPVEDAKRATRAASAKRSSSGASGARAKAAAKAAKSPTAQARRRVSRVDWSRKAAALPGARKARLAVEAFPPQLAVAGDRPPAGEDWIHELKWDGYRLVAVVDGGKARLWSRNAIEWTGKVPEITAALEQLGLKSAALDGELIAGSGRRDDFGELQATLSGERHAPLTYVLFDLLHVEGVAIDRAPLSERKALLERILERPVPHLAYSSHIQGEATAAFELAHEQGFEGMISKRADHPHHGGRSDDWRKSKHMLSDEFAVVGYTAPKGSRSGFGSLLLARPDGKGGWRYAGKVGSGFSDRLLAELHRKIGKSGGIRPTVFIPEHDTDLRTARWFDPKFVVEVFFRGKGSEGLLRQPSLKAVRADKNVGDLLDPDRGEEAAFPKGGKVMAKAATQNRTAAHRAPAAAKKAPAKRVSRGTAKKKPAEIFEPVRITHPERVVYADAGYTKQDVADYYLAVMDRLLPEIAGRPLSIIRCPSGADKACFFQKHHTAGLKRVDTVRLKEEAGNQANYLVVNDAEALMELVQFNALEFHPWGSHANEPGRADRLVFDLDPGPGVSWTDVKKAAVRVRDLLADLSLTSFLRTSGGKGLHVVVPLNPGCEWDLVKSFARGFAEAMAGSEPQRYVATAAKKLRNGRIFIDYLRNGRGATSVASYSLRARPGAPVAVPLAWSELARLKRSDAYDIRSLPARLKRLRKDPWDGIDTLRQNLSRWTTK